MKSLRRCLMAVAIAMLSLASACSPPEETNERPVETPPEEETAAPAEETLALSTMPETTAGEATGEGTLGSASMDTSGVVLRLEGDEGTRFSGLCAVGGEESVLSGEVPKRFTFADPGVFELSCRIQKQDERSGNLRVILLSGDTTRSVQQTNAPEGTIEVSFSN
ncbi:MAG: hypothetical protein M3494_02330 [Actinomycetota bacterium]|nr:hypothetical protein [Actinomycetota bacterium]